MSLGSCCWSDVPLQDRWEPYHKGVCLVGEGRCIVTHTARANENFQDAMLGFLAVVGRGLGTLTRIKTISHESYSTCDSISNCPCTYKFGVPSRTLLHRS